MLFAGDVLLECEKLVFQELIFVLVLHPEVGPKATGELDVELAWYPRPQLIQEVKYVKVLSLFIRLIRFFRHVIELIKEEALKLRLLLVVEVVTEQLQG